MTENHRNCELLCDRGIVILTILIISSNLKIVLILRDRFIWGSFFFCRGPKLWSEVLRSPSPHSCFIQYTLSLYFLILFLCIRIVNNPVSRVDFLLYCRSELMNWHQLCVFVIWTQRIAICYHDGHNRSFFDT